MNKALKAPFPYFGGKSRAASLVWERFGDVPNYVEPFFGSGAVLLGRPHAPRIETVNDLDCYLANFWRATSHDPEHVAQYADSPVNEADLYARHGWLVSQVDFRERIRNDPNYYDPKIAGWWVYGISCWIGSGWCVSDSSVYHPNKRPHLGDSGMGIHRVSINSLVDYFMQLQDRLRRVRVCCGDWSRVTGSGVTVKHGVTGVFLDPPYADTAGRDPTLYSEDSLMVAHDVREWALANGDDPLFRIALAGYDGEHTMLDSWECVPWKARTGGYGMQRKDGSNQNRHKERIWFSPHCLHSEQSSFVV